jgi:amino acid transporter
MKKNVLVFGLIAGAIVSVFMAVTIGTHANDPDFEHGMLLGYAAMLVAFSFVFVGIKNYRDKYNGGLITFGKAFKVGILISLIASTLYVITWMIMFNFFIPDFMDKYSVHMMNEVKASGVSQEKMAEKMTDIAKMKEWYKNPVFVILMTYLEVLPVGLVFALIGALIFKRKPKDAGTTVMA